MAPEFLRWRCWSKKGPVTTFLSGNLRSGNKGFKASLGSGTTQITEAPIWPIALHDLTGCLGSLGYRGLWGGSDSCHEQTEMLTFTVSAGSKGKQNTKECCQRRSATKLTFFSGVLCLVPSGKAVSSSAHNYLTPIYRGSTAAE